MPPVHILWLRPKRHFGLRNGGENIPMHWNPRKWFYDLSQCRRKNLNRFSFLDHFQIDINDGTSKKICQLCFDKINEFDSFRELCATSQQNVRSLSGLPNEDEDTTVNDLSTDLSNTEPNAAEECSLEETSENSDDGLSPAAGTHDIESTGTKT